MSAFETLRNAMAAALNVDAAEIDHGSAQGNLAAWDSLGQVNLMMAIEDTFDVRLEVEELSELNSVASILHYLKTRGIE